MAYTKTASNSQHTVLRQNLTVDSTNGENSTLNLAFSRLAPNDIYDGAFILLCSMS